MKKMRILQVLNSDSYSGAENVVCQIIGMFRDIKNIEMVYCSPDGPIRNILIERGIDYILLKKLSVGGIKKVIKKVCPDIIQAHDFRASILCTVACKNIPVISHLHNNPPWLKKCGIYSFVFKATCHRYENILTVSDSVFNEFVYGNKFRNKLTVIGNPINVSEIRSKVTQIDNEKLYDLGFCGRFSFQKKPEGFIGVVESLYREMPNIRVAMVGDGGQFEEMKLLIRQKKLENVITLYGFQKNPYNIMNSFKILCMPSRWEGFGLVAIEALSLGVPVVCSNVGGLPGIINESCGKVCTSEDEMAAFCKTLLADKQILQVYSCNAKERAAELDNTVEYKKRLTEIYEDLR